MSIRNEIHVIAPGGGNPTNLKGHIHIDSTDRIEGYVTGLGTISFDIPEDRKGWGANVYVSCDGSKESDVRVVTGIYDGSLLVRDLPIRLEPSAPPFPPRKSRDEICKPQLTAQGLVVNVDGYGNLPWFEPAYQCMNDVQRAQVRAAKRAAGDTHLLLEFFTNAESLYDEPGQPYQAIRTFSGEQEPARFLALVEEVITYGFVPLISYDGDDADNPMGYPNALRQLPILQALLASSAHRDLNLDVLYVRFWDGVFYGSSPEHIQAFGTAFRALIPNGYLGIEHSTGHIPAGEGGSDYQPGGRMDAYDVVFSEFNNLLPRNADPNPNNNPGCSIWQIVGRLAQPYVRPADQPPSTDSYPPPHYLTDSPRGPRYACAFEYGIYDWVRVNMNNYWPLQRTIEGCREYLQSLSPSPFYTVS